MRNIVVVTNGTLPIPSVRGGAAETLLNNFINKNEKTNDFSFTVFSLYDDEAHFLSRNLKNVEFSYIKETFQYKIKRILRFLFNKITFIPNQFLSMVLKHSDKFSEADLILVENNPYFLPFLRKITNKPIILHLHNDYLNIDNYERSNYLLTNIDGVLCVSKFVQKRVKEVAPLSCNVSCVHNGIDISKFNCSVDYNEIKRLRSRYGLKSDDITVLFVGRLQESKGIKLLIQVINKIPDNLNIKLLIVGSTGYKGSKSNSFYNELEVLSKKKPGRVIFSGYINYDELPTIYKIGDFAIFPSLAVEAFPLVSIEAQASSLPVIITNVGGMPETISDQSGILINKDQNIEKSLYDAILRLSLDSELKKNMSKAALENAKKYNNEIYYEELSKELIRLI